VLSYLIVPYSLCYLQIDQHYYAIASKATILKPAQLNVPADKFKAKFGLEWADALKAGNVYNALDACEKVRELKTLMTMGPPVCTPLPKVYKGYNSGFIFTIELLG